MVPLVDRSIRCDSALKEVKLPWLQLGGTKAVVAALAACESATRDDVTRIRTAIESDGTSIIHFKTPWLTVKDPESRLNLEY